MVAILEKTEHHTYFHQIVDFLEASHIRRYTRRAKRIAQSKALSLAADETASLSRDDRQGEAFPTISSFDAEQDRENIAKTSTLPHESSSRVTSLDADEGSMQQRIHELMELCTSLQRQESQMAAKIKDQNQEISELKARVKFLKDKESRSAEPTQEDAPIIRGIIEIGEELRADKSTELMSNDTEEMVNVLSSMDDVNILTSGGAAASVSPGDVLPTVGVPSFSGSFPTVSAIFTTASVIMIKGLDKSNEVLAKHLREYEQAEADLFVGEKIELISELVKYQDHRAKILKYQAQQSKPLSKKDQREFYMSVLRSHTGWKTKHFRGMTLEQIKEKFIPVWKQLKDFVPMSSKEESKRVKRQGLKIDQGSEKRVKTSKSVYEDVYEEELKGMMQLVPLEEVYVEALQGKHPIIDWDIHSEGKREYWKIIRLGGHTTVYQFFVDMLKQLDRKDLHQLWTLVKETFSIKQATCDKEKELWVELRRLFEPNFEDQLWTHHQAFMHDSLDWKLYDICGVHHVSTKDQEIFMLVEKDYPLRKGLAAVMIFQDEELFEASSLLTITLQAKVVDLSLGKNITYSDDAEDVGAEADFTNLEITITVSPIPTTRVHKDDPVTQIIGDLSSATQTRSMTKMVKDQSRLTQINNEDFHTCIFACFLSQEEPKREGIDYEEVFAPVAKIEAISLFLAYASFMGFMVYQMDVKSAFLYGTIKEEVYVYQPLGFEDPDYPDKIYKVVTALYGLHQAPRAWYETLANYLLENGFQRGKIDQTLFIKKQKGDILLVQVYVDDIIFGSTNKDLCKAFEKLMKDKFQMSSMGSLCYGKSASTLIDTEKPLLKDPDGEGVDVHTYRENGNWLIVTAVSLKFLLFGLSQPAASTQATNQLLQVDRSSRIHSSIPQSYMIGEAHVQHNNNVKRSSLCSKTTLVMHPQPSGQNMRPRLHADLDVFQRYSQLCVENARSWSSLHNSPMHTAPLKGTTLDIQRTTSGCVKRMSLLDADSDRYLLPPFDSQMKVKRGMQADVWFGVCKQDRKATILYEYETFKANEGEKLLDTYLRYLQVINDLKKCGYKKDNCKLNYKFLNNLQPEWKQYGTLMRQTKNLMDINIDALYNIINKNQGDVNDAFGYKKKSVVVHSDLLALVAEKMNVSKRKEKVVISSDSKGSSSDDFSELKKITALLAKAFNRRKFYSKPTNNNLITSSTSQSANKKQKFVKSDDKKEDKKANEKKRDMSKVKCYNYKKEGHFAKDCKKAKVKDYNYYKTKMLLAKKDNESSSSAKETIAEVDYYTSESESEYKFKTSEYYDNSTNYGLFVKNNDDQEIFHDAIESASKNFIENHIDSQKDYDKSEGDYNDFEEKELLVDKLIRKYNQLDKHVRDLKNTVLEKDFKISELEECVCNKDLEIEKCLESLNVCENKLHKMGQTNQTVHMIMPSKDNLYNGRKGIGFDNLSYFDKAKDLRPTLYDEKVIGLGYTLMFLTHSDEALEIEKFKRSRENKIKFAYDYGNLNASYVNEKINFEDDYFQEIINPDFDKIVSSFHENDCHVFENECDKLENPKVIAPGMFKLSVSQSVSPISMSKMSWESNNVEIKLKRKRRKRKSSKHNVKQVNNDVSRANSDFVHFSDLNTFSSVRRPEHSSVVWKKKGSSNTFNVDLSAVSHSNLNKNVKRYSRKDLLACNNSHLGETSSASVCNDDMNVSCNSKMCDLLDDNNFFIFNDESVRISPVSKMPFRKKPRDSINFVQIYLWIIDSGCSKHMTGSRALLTNFVEKLIETVRFGNNDFAVIAGYGDVGLEVAFRKSTCFVRNEDGVDLLTGDRSLNLYTIALNEVASNSSTCLLAKAYSSQSWLWHQCLSHLNFATINNIVKNNLVQGLPKMKFEKDHLCSACEREKIHQKHHKSKTAFASNKPLYLLHMDLCGPMCIQSINGKRYVLVVVDDFSRYTWVFFLHLKDEASKVIISFIKKTQVNL
nr:putative ribonuclease H-like domain-containing protein [Tanacetum cinerariifolium]